ncbi:PAS domain-containing sensor histidine kinase [Rapidithrix thailandica]|uniref:histidine kinase n=1 Tax=Rapidithrix thailandica TaxID=413964 RepID=A0AAW9SC82_9BACT
MSQPKHTKEKIENNQQLTSTTHKHVFENLIIGIIEINQEGKIVYFNTKVNEWLASNLELLSHSYKQLPGEFLNAQQVCFDPVAWAWKQQKAVSFTWKIPTLSATFQGEAVPDMQNDCLLLQLLPVIKEPVLSSSQTFVLNNSDLFKKVFAKMNDGLIVVDAQHCVLHVNKSFLKILRISDADGLLGKPLGELLVEVGEDIDNNVLTQLHQYKGRALEFVIRDTSGKRHWIDIRQSYVPVKELFGFEKVYLVKDITLQKESEEQIKSFSERLYLACQAAKIGIWDYHVKENQEFWDERMFEIYGIREENVNNLTNVFQQSLHPDDRHLDEIAAQKAFRGIKDYNTEFRIIRPDGRLRYIKALAKVLFDVNQEPYRMIGVNWDITERKLAENKILEKNEELKKINKELDQFVYSVSHDLKAPLTSIIGLIRLCRDDTSSPTILEYLQLMERSATKLNNFIQDIAQFSRNARLEVKRERIDFEQLMNDVFEGQKFNENAQKIHKELQLDLQEPFFSDPGRLEIILNNLVANAFRYANLYHPNPQVKVQVIVSGNEALMRVTDNGVGIGSKHIDKIFDMFYRASHDSKGSGLGLSIVKETVEKLNGSIEVQSQFGEGSTFSVKIPSLV